MAIDWGHIVERFFIHLAAGSFIFWFAYFGISFWKRKGFKYVEYILPALLVFFVTSLREPFDVAHGQPIIKVITDWISWILGGGLAAFAVYRIRNTLTN